MKTTQPIKVPKKKEHYVSNKEFLVAMKDIMSLIKNF